MKRRCFALALCLVLAASATNAANLSVPPSDGPLPVTVLVYMLDLDQVDSSQQTFTANVFLEVTWTDSRLVHESDGPIVKAMGEIWHPGMQILNQQKLFKTFPEELRVFPDGHVTYRQRYWGDFSQPMDLRNYPADNQELTVHLVAAGYSPDQVELLASEEAIHAISDEISVTDFFVTGSEVVVDSYNPMDFGPGVAAIRSTYFATRKTGYFVVKVIIPLILIVMMSWAVFWIDPAEGGTQIGVATTTMLTLIAFRFAIDASLPRISYLTRLDAFVMASTVLVFLSLFEVVLTSRWAKTGHHERAMLLDRWSRLIFPAAFFVVLAWSFLNIS